MTPSHKQDVIIAVMGSTGTGKSSFIKLLTGDRNIKIGNEIESETTDVQTFDLRDQSGRRVIMVDTPGFDDSRHNDSDTEILKKIAEFLVNEYDTKRKLNGLIYLHRISDPRFGGQSYRNLKMFRNLCGTAAYENVVVVTTFWDKVTAGEGIEREAQLKATAFKDLIEGGAHFTRHDRTRGNAQTVVRRIFMFIPMHVRLVEEIREEGKSLENTAAGSVRREEVERIIAQHKKEMADIQAELGKIKERNGELRRELEQERGKVKHALERIQRERKALKDGLDDGKKSRKLLEAEVEQARRDHEWRRDHESRAEAQRKRHNESLRVVQGQLDRERKIHRNLEASSAWKNDSNPKFQFLHPPQYPPHLKSIPTNQSTGVFEIFNFKALLETAASLVSIQNVLPWTQNLAPTPDEIYTMQDLVNFNHQRRIESLQQIETSSTPNMYFKENIGHRDDWYTDAVFGQQQFTGTNPTTITIAPHRWIDAFEAAARAQQRTDVTKLLVDRPGNVFIQDYSDFRSAMGVAPGAELTSEGRYGCSSVALFHLEAKGKLHPLAIILDYKGSIEKSVIIFNRRLTSTTPYDESADWPWRYAKMCAQVSDWFRHEIAVHLVYTHLIEEVIIVAANRTLEPDHIVFQLLEPHWTSTLSLNKSARETLVPKIIIGMTGFTAQQTYSFLMESYDRFEWTDYYVPNDLRRRGFPMEDLDKVEYHNYGYARDIALIWEILRKFVAMVLTEVYASDKEVKNDISITAFCREVSSDSGGQLTSFPIIETLDDLIDFVTMCIHIASPQHSAVNYLQQYYQTFVPNKPSALRTPLPQSLAELEDFEEEDLLLALPINQPRDWLMMAQVPYLLSFEVPEDSTILHYATTTSNSGSTPEIIQNAADVLKIDLDNFIDTVYQKSGELDDQKTPYLVLDPSKTAISILI